MSCTEATPWPVWLTQLLQGAIGGVVIVLTAVLIVAAGALAIWVLDR